MESIFFSFLEKYFLNGLTMLLSLEQCFILAVRSEECEFFFFISEFRVNISGLSEYERN